jgi:hypothetical protein
MCPAPHSDTSRPSICAPTRSSCALFRVQQTPPFAGGPAGLSFDSLGGGDWHGTTDGSAGTEVGGGVSDGWMDTLHQRMWTSFTTAE